MSRWSIAPAAMLIAACTRIEALIIPFPPGEAPATELLAFEERVHAVEVGSSWRPPRVIGEDESLKLSALIYPGSLAELGLQAGLQTEPLSFGPLRLDGAAFELEIVGGVAGAWRALAAPPAVLEPYRLRFAVTAIAGGTGEGHRCVITAGGRLYCWGDNAEGQVGVANQTIVRQPVEVAAEIAQVTLGLKHTCLLTRDGRAFCFGSNLFEQLGRTTTGRRDPIPAVVFGVDGISELSAAGHHTCALHDGRVSCWGRLLDLQAPDPKLTVIAFPAAIERIEAGVYGICGLSRGKLFCSGYAGPHGLPGAMCFKSQLIETPVQIVLTGTVADFAAGDANVCAVTTEGELYCWGCNDLGQVGTGVARPCDVLPPECVEDERPVRIASRVRAVELGYQFGCALDEMGRVSCWGSNGAAQIGIGTSDNTEVHPPTLVRGIDERVVELEVHWEHACARTESGAIYCWGDGVGTPERVEF